MALRTNFWLGRAAFLCCAIVLPRLAQAQARDTPHRAGGSRPGDIEPTTVRWHDTYLYWDHAVTTSTLGVGRDYQTRNPVYEMTIGLRPRYAFVENERYTVSVRGDLGVVSERTDSDATTRRGEWTANDFEFWGSFTYKLRESRNDLTELSLRLPRLTLPTSKVSYRSGKLLGLGARAGIREEFVLAGREAPFFSSVELFGKAEYGYLFTDSQVPTNGGLERIRLGPEGRSIVSDQLAGATLARHSAAFGVASWVHVHPRVNWVTGLEIRPAWKYPVDRDVQICGVVLTGCTTASGIADPQTRSTLTYFQSDVWFRLTDVLELTVGYANLATQLGPDGRRRSAFYSPDARFYLTLNVYLDQLYVGLSPGARQNASAREPRIP